MADISEYERRAKLLAMPYEKRIMLERQWAAYEARLAELRYNPYHDPKTGRFTSGGLTGGSNSDILKPDELIGKSLGASGKNYPVKLPDGNHTKIVEGTSITQIKAFAGAGTNKPIREAKILENNYKIPADKWQKVRGNAFVFYNTKKRKCELHWYEAEEKKVKMKVKRWLDED